MARGIIGGMTDYRHQSLDDIIEDIDKEFRNISAFINAIEHNIEISEQSGYWQNKVPFDFQNIVQYSLKHFKTSKTELESIGKELRVEVKQNHCKRLRSIAIVAYDINIDIGKIWNNDMTIQDYGNPDFELIPRIYADTRDMAVNLLDMSNISSRLEDFVGMKKIDHTDSTKDLKNILFLSSSPNNEDRISVDIEMRKIEEALECAKFRDNFLLNKKVAVKPETMTKAMIDFSPNIVHFSGHGDNNGIAVENEDGDSVYFPAEGLVRLFSLFKDSITCVILNSCYSEEQANAISKNGMYVIGHE